MWRYNDDYYPTYKRYEFEVNMTISRRCSVWIPSNIKDEDAIRNAINAMRYSTDIEVIDEKLEDYDIIDIIETEDVE